MIRVLANRSDRVDTQTPGFKTETLQIVLADRRERRTVAYPVCRDELKQEAPKEQDTQDDDDCDDDDLH